MGVIFIKEMCRNYVLTGRIFQSPDCVKLYPFFVVSLKEPGAVAFSCVRP
jgi:hypothetical protein